ncbi:hypothetical protein H1R20_g7655, partial [Candolleomyces eurysporus]
MDNILRLLHLVLDKLNSDPVILRASIGFLAVTSYLCLVRCLRWRRYHDIHRKYEKKWREGVLTPAEAQEIRLLSSFYDCPMLLHKAVAFALFKTYAIPSISKLLLSTKELSSSERMPKRFADTEILIATFVGCPISGSHDTTAPPDPTKPAEDPRAAIALARMNFIHSKYKISNDDYLYTLSLFILEPARWADLYSWRSLSQMEQEAFFIFYADVGRKMGITDIPETLEELKAWSEAYEEVYMVPAETNNLVAGYTVAELLYAVPKKFGMKAFAERVVIALLEERVRIAMLYKSVPWYKEEPKGRLSYVFAKLAVMLGIYAAMPGPQFRSQGYRLEEVGPQQFEGAGVEEVFNNAEKFQGCPIVAPWRPATALRSEVVDRSHS